MRNNNGYSYLNNREVILKLGENKPMNELPGWITLLLLLIGVSFGVNTCSNYMDTPEYKSKREARLKECNTPYFVSEVDGIKLYVIQPDCGRPVYFSKTGTHTTHTERRGKASIEVDDDTSNAQ